MQRITAEGKGRAAWLVRFFQVVDSMDAPGYAALFTPEGRFALATFPEARGREAIHGFVEAFFGSIAGIAHQVHRIW